METGVLSMKYYVIDAFTDEVFRGNPAGVCLLEQEMPDELMQKIAFENNLAETAFLLRRDNTYDLRWFTPEVEIDLCGHGTLATAFVVMNYVEAGLQYIEFQTKSGVLSVARNADYYMMNFPSRMPVATKKTNLLEEALGCKVLETYQSRDLLVIVEDEETVANLNVNYDLLSQNSKGAGVGDIYV